MRQRFKWAVIGAAAWLMGCGGGQPAAAPAEPVASAKAAPKQKPAPQPPEPEPEPPPPEPSLATECASEDKPCVPPGEWVERLCHGKYPSVALVMFEKSAPWKHMYVKPADGVDASNTIGGPTGDTRLQFGEEVLVLRHFSGGTGGVQVSGAGGYHVFRWDGTCSTVSEHELVPYQPGVPRHAPFVWKYIDPPIQEALLQHKGVAAARTEQRKRCKGVSQARADQPCQRAAKALRKAIIARLKRGAELPLPDKLP